MKISQALSQAKEKLKKAQITNYSLDALLLVCHVKKFSKEKIIFNPELELKEEELIDFFKLITRRQKGEPISHLIENREFFGFDFFVNKNVLDPRPDSEILVETVIKNYLKESKLSFLELGIGSGCLSISLLKNFENFNAIGVDISPLALEVAKKNARKHDILERLELKESDLFLSLNKSEKFDFIISNPPYIPSKNIKNLQIEVRDFEPHLALDGGDDGFDFYRKIARNSREFLKENSYVFLEIGQNQEREIEKIFNKFSFELIAANKDLAGIVRVLTFK